MRIEKSRQFVKLANPKVEVKMVIIQSAQSCSGGPTPANKNMSTLPQATGLCSSDRSFFVSTCYTSPAAVVANHSVPSVLVGGQLRDLLRKCLHFLDGLLHREPVLLWVGGSPALVVGLVLLLAAFLALDLLAHGALVSQWNGCIHHL